MSRTNDFTEGKILSPLLRFALPVLAALFLQAMYGAVDLWVVGKFAETADISAVSTGSQIMHSITGFLVGLSTGITVLVAQKIGEKRPDDAGKAIGNGITLFAVLAVIFTVLMLSFTPQISKLMNAPEKAFSQTVDYVRICSAGTVFIIAYNVLGSVFRGIGDSKMPLITVSIACVINIAGDLILVKVFGMGAAGAAYATVGAQAISVFLSLIVISKRKLPFEFGKKCMRFDFSVCGRILRIGSPIAFQDALVSISFLVIFSIVNSLGLVASAGVGVAEKLCAFVMLVPSAYSQSMSAFVGQNIGARKPDRAKKALFCGIASSLVAGVFMGYLSFFHGDMLSLIFAKDPEVIAAAASYLKAYAIDCLFTSFLFCFIGFYSGLGKTVFVMVQGVIGAFCVRVPVSYFVSKIPDVPLFYIGLATPASTVLQIIMCFAFFAFVNKEFKNLYSKSLDNDILDCYNLNK